MPWFLEYKLWRLAKRADPAPAFIHALEQRLRQNTGHPVHWMSAWKLAVNSMVALTLAAASGTGVYAYTSDEVLPEHLLYPVRLKIETVEAALPLRGELMTNVDIKQLKRRVREQQIIQQRNLPLTKRNVKAFVKQLKKTVAANYALPQTLRQDVAHTVDQLEQKQDAAANPPEVYEWLHQADQTVDLLHEKFELFQELAPTSELEGTTGTNQ